MADNYERTENAETVVMQKESKPLHVRIVSIGAFLLLSFAVLFILDYIITALTYLIGMNLGWVSQETTAVLYLAVRIEGWLIFIISMILALRGHKLYAHRMGKYIRQLILLLICLTVIITYSIGIGLILFFGVFFWSPKQMANLEDWQMKIYRGVFLGVIFGVILAEMTLTRAAIGVSLVRPFLTRSLVYFLELGLLFSLSN